MLLAGCAAERGNGPSALDARTASPALEFRSAFDGYRAFSDQELADWRKANEEVTAAGGPVEHGGGHR